MEFTIKNIILYDTFQNVSGFAEFKIRADRANIKVRHNLFFDSREPDSMFGPDDEALLFSVVLDGGQSHIYSLAGVQSLFELRGKINPEREIFVCIIKRSNGELRTLASGIINQDRKNINNRQKSSKEIYKKIDSSTYNEPVKYRELVKVAEPIKPAVNEKPIKQIKPEKIVEPAEPEKKIKISETVKSEKEKTSNGLGESVKFAEPEKSFESEKSLKTVSASSENIIKPAENHDVIKSVGIREEATKSAEVREVDEVLRKVCTIDEDGKGKCETCPYRDYFYQFTLDHENITVTTQAAAATSVFFDIMKNQIENILNNNPPFDFLNYSIENSRFVHITDGHAVGIIYNIHKQPAFLCSAAYSASHDLQPPDLAGFAQWLPKDSAKPESEGYWLSYQEIATGQQVILSQK